ncbi:MAG: hypothetical protein NTU91_11075 [Chloroflexi bacterium]|nr:hypothetical protein [Chloroflexota bacterium]
MASGWRALQLMRESVRHTLRMNGKHSNGHPKLRHLSTIGVVAVLQACGVDLTPPAQHGPPRPGPVIAVNATHLSWTTDSVVRLTIGNPDGVPIYYTCPLEQLEYYRDGWRLTSWSYGCINDFPTLPSLSRGDSIVRSHRLTNDFIPQSGWYRFKLWLFRASTFEAPWDEASRVSPAFHVGP